MNQAQKDRIIDTLLIVGALLMIWWALNQTFCVHPPYVDGMSITGE